MQASAAAGRPLWPRPTRAPISSSGSSIRRIGRERSEASPSKTAVIGQPATAPITSRQPVPELPKSSGAAGCGEAADADAAHRPGERAGPLDLCAQRPHRFGGIEDVLALEQARKSGFRRPPARPGSGPGAKSTCRRERGPSRSRARWRGLPAGSDGRNGSRLCPLAAGRYHIGDPASRHAPLGGKCAQSAIDSGPLN